MRLDNSRHELFCQRVAAGMPASRAYAAAGYSARGNAAESSASRLLRRDKVKARIGELLQSSAKEIRIDKERLTGMLLEDRALAHQKGQAAAALAITVQIGKLHGFRFDGTDVDSVAASQPRTKEIDFKAANARFRRLSQLQ